MRESAARRLLELMMMLYPRSFRHDVGPDLVDTAVDRWRDARRHGGATGEVRYWLTDGLRFAVDGVLERARAIAFGAAVETSHAWRQVRRAPRHYGIAILTLALGVGATTTMFTVADAVVFRPLPYPQPNELYLVHTQFGTLELSSNSLPNLVDMAAQVPALASLAGAADRSPALSDDAVASERISVIDATDAYLPALGARVMLGRAFVADDHAAEATRVVIVSHALWRRRWGGDPGVLGSTVRLDDVPYVVIGVMAPSFRDPEPIESGAATGAWAPVRGTRGIYGNRDYYAFRIIARRSADVSHDVARQQLTAVGAALSAAYPDANRLTGETMDFVLHPLHEATVGDARARMLLLLGAVLLLLLLSCANVANLFLARGVTRGPELAVRAALGASSRRLGAQLFVESLFTAAVASAVGAGLATYGVRAFIAAAPPGIPRLSEVALDARVLGFIILLTIATAVFFGSIPAVRGAAMARAAASGARSTAVPAAQRFQSVLLSVEVALALVLLTGSALLVNSFRNMSRVDPGFAARDVAVVDVRPPRTATSHELSVLFYDELAQRVAALPGVTRVALLHTVPGIAGGAWSKVTTDDRSRPAVPTQRSTAPATGTDPGNDFLRLNPVRGDAPAVLGIPLAAGRWFEGEPSAGDPLVVVINEAAARALYPGVSDVIGRRLHLGPAEAATPPREIIGVVGNVRQRGAARDPDPQIYLPYGQRDIGRMSLVLKLAPGATIDATSVRRAVHDVAPDLPVDRMELLSASYSAVADAPRFLAFLLTIFAALGLMLAMVGTYALASQTMVRRIREMGVRLALGAHARDVFGLVLFRALRTVAAGVAAGLVLTLGLVRFVESYVFGISARDPRTFAIAAALIGMSAAAASLAPAIRAARIDPNEVLRRE